MVLTKNIKIDKIVTKYLEALYIICKNERKFHFETIEDLFYDCFEDIYKETVKQLKKMGVIVTKKPIDTSKLTWDKDESKLRERILKYLTSFEDDKYYIPQEEFNVDFRDLSDLLENEAKHMSEEVVYEKLKDNYPFCEIFGAGECGGCSGNLGIMKTADLERRPPFHPSCTCSIRYYTEDEVDFDEVEDIL